MGAKKKAGAKKGGKKKLSPEEEAKKRANDVDDITNEDYKETLMLELHQLRSDTTSEDSFAWLYQQEKERINYFWIAEKKRMDERQADLRNKERDLQDLTERQQIEIRVCKQRVKHLKFQDLDQLTEQKIDHEKSLKNSEDDHRYKQRELKYDKRALKVQEKEKQVCQDDYKRALMKEQDKRMTEMRHTYERDATDMKNKYFEKMNKTRFDMENKRKKLIEAIENKKNKAITDLTDMHKQKYVNIKSYYSNTTQTNFDTIKMKKDEVGDLRKKCNADGIELRNLERRNNDNAEPLKELKSKNIELEEELKKYHGERNKLHATKDAIEGIEADIRNCEWEYEVLLQQYNYLVGERNDLYEKYSDSIFEIQQKSGLKNIILEKKLETINETLEAKDVQLNQVLSAASIDPRTLQTVTQSLEDVENAKNEQIVAIQGELKKIREAHSNMVKTYESKLAEFGIPVEELGFDPLVPANV